MFIKNEQQLLTFIKYSPIVIITMVAIIINILIFLRNEKDFKKDLQIYKKNYIESNKFLVKSQVDRIYNDILSERQFFESKFKKDLDINNKYTKDIQRHILAKYIQNPSYSKNGYVFIFTYEGIQLTHIKKEYLGKNRFQEEDLNGFRYVKGIIDQAKSGSGFIEYIGSVMPQTGLPAHKTTYVKGIQDWGWAIGSGFYNLDLVNYLNQKEKELRILNSKSLKETIIVSLILTIFLLGIALYISSIVERFFKEYQDKIQKQIEANRKKDMLLYQQSKMASMGEMLGNIAHQWRQPLSLISTVASGAKIQKELNVLKDENFSENMNTIVNTTQHLSQTIDDFRRFFSPNKELKKINTKIIYEKSIQLISSRLSSKDIILESKIDEIDINTYENELLQALINILNNAIDAFENKKQEKKLIRFIIKYEKECKIPNCNMKDCLQGKQGYLSIYIEDNAGGIDKNNIDKIFDLYFTTKHQSQGTGIGLYMTYEIIHKHLKGFIRVENIHMSYNNESFEGSKFNIFLPLNPIVC